MKIKYIILITICIGLFLFSCTRVIVPPVIDLKTYQAVGIIMFKCSEGGNLDAFVTQKFIQEITKDQKSIEILELGKEADILTTLQKTTLDIDAYKAIGQKYNLKSIVTGDIEISDIQPEINIAPGFSFIGASGVVTATLITRMIETSNGATVWTGSAREKREVGSISLVGGHFMFDAQDPEQAYGPMAEALVKKATKDFKKTGYWRSKCF